MNATVRSARYRTPLAAPNLADLRSRPKVWRRWRIVHRILTGAFEVRGDGKWHVFVGRLDVGWFASRMTAKAFIDKIEEAGSDG